MFVFVVIVYWFVGYFLMYGDFVIDGWLYFGGFFFDLIVIVEIISEVGLVFIVDFLF